MDLPRGFMPGHSGKGFDMGTFSRILGKKEDAAPGHEFSGSDTVSLTIDERRSSRLITETKDGTKCVILLERGLIVRCGTVLGDEDGSLLLVEAAPEEVSTVRANSPLELTRLAYHLGNRHVPLEITSDYLRYQHDHVLDDMVRGLGGTVAEEQATFEPENGAYSHHHHHDGDDHDHEHHHHHDDDDHEHHHHDHDD